MQDYPKFTRAVLMVRCGQCAESDALDPSVAFRTMRQDPGFQSMRATCTARAKSVSIPLATLACFVERIFTCAPRHPSEQPKDPTKKHHTDQVSPRQRSPHRLSYRLLLPHR